MAVVAGVAGVALVGWFVVGWLLAPDVGDLVVGDCITRPPGASASEVELADCDADHDAQVVAVLESAPKSGESPRCQAAAEAFVVEERVPAELTAMLLPGDDGAGGACIISRTDQQPLTESLGRDVSEG